MLHKLLLCFSWRFARRYFQYKKSDFQKYCSERSVCCCLSSEWAGEWCASWPRWIGGDFGILRCRERSKSAFQLGERRNRDSENSSLSSRSCVTLKPHSAPPRTDNNYRNWCKIRRVRLVPNFGKIFIKCCAAQTEPKNTIMVGTNCRWMVCMAPLMWQQVGENGWIGSDTFTYDINGSVWPLSVIPLFTI